MSTTRATSSAKIKLEEGRDYYIDRKSGFMVFTASYLKERGYCCDSGCRHCPYRSGSQTNLNPSTTLNEIDRI